MLYVCAVASPVNDPSCKPELALVEYSPQPIRESPDPVIEGASFFPILILKFLHFIISNRERYERIELVSFPIHKTQIC